MRKIVRGAGLIPISWGRGIHISSLAGLPAICGLQNDYSGHSIQGRCWVTGTTADLYQRADLLIRCPVQERYRSSISGSGRARAVGGGLEGRPRQLSIFRMASGGWISARFLCRESGSGDGITLEGSVLLSQVYAGSSNGISGGHDLRQSLRSSSPEPCREP